MSARDDYLRVRPVLAKLAKNIGANRGVLAKQAGLDLQLLEDVRKREFGAWSMFDTATLREVDERYHLTPAELAGKGGAPKVEEPPAAEEPEAPVPPAVAEDKPKHSARNRRSGPAKYVPALQAFLRGFPPQKAMAALGLGEAAWYFFKSQEFGTGTLDPDRVRAWLRSHGFEPTTGSTPSAEEQRAETIGTRTPPAPSAPPPVMSDPKPEIEIRPPITPALLRNLSERKGETSEHVIDIGGVKLRLSLTLEVKVVAA